MKIRQSFITNSSSSSFIVAIDKNHIPKSIEEMQKLLFGEDQYYLNPYADQYSNEVERVWTTNYVAEKVFQDFQPQVPLTETEMIEEVTSGHVDFLPYRDHYDDIGWNKKSIDERIKIWDEDAEEDRKIALDKVKDIRTAYPNHKFFIFEYSDNDGALATSMEHGTLFNNLFHIRISKH
jgi:hypothetical protein